MQINGHEIYIETHGKDGNPVVLLLHHGLGCVQSWRAQIRPLTHAGFRVIVYDRWGYGRSAPRPTLGMPYFEEDIEDVETILDSFKIKQAALVGHSDGGTIALYFAACRPERVSRLVTAAAHIYVEPKMDTGIQGVRQYFESDSLFRAALERLHGDKTEAVFYGWYDGWRQQENLTWDMRPALTQIVCPTLVAQGELDEHATPQQARDIAEAISQAELWLVEDANHMFPQERAEDFNDRLFSFLA